VNITVKEALIILQARGNSSEHHNYGDHFQARLVRAAEHIINREYQQILARELRADIEAQPFP